MRSLLLFAALWTLAAPAFGEAKKIVMIGGKATSAARTILPLLGARMRANPAFAGCEIWLYPTGWPEDPQALEGVAALLVYTERIEELPDGAEQTLERMSGEGTGVVAVCGCLPLVRPLALVHADVHDELAPNAAHALSRGLTPFAYHEAADALGAGEAVTPILRDAIEQCFAWTVESRAGLIFQFTGGRRAEDFDQPQIAKLLLNALAWTAGLEVPANGVETTDPVVGAAIVTKPEENEVIPQEWGKLSWYTSAKLKNTRTLTSGMAVLKAGQSNPRHFHPNCDEVLHVLQGKIRHSMNDKTVEMSAGDTVSIPSGVVHNAANIGQEDAVLAISFSSAYRVVIGEK